MKLHTARIFIIFPSSHIKCVQRECGCDVYTRRERVHLHIQPFVCISFYTHQSSHHGNIWMHTRRTQHSQNNLFKLTKLRVLKQIINIWLIALCFDNKFWFMNVKHFIPSLRWSISAYARILGAACRHASTNVFVCVCADVRGDTCATHILKWIWEKGRNRNDGVRSVVVLSAMMTMM